MRDENALLGSVRLNRAAKRTRERAQRRRQTRHRKSGGRQSRLRPMETGRLLKDTTKKGNRKSTEREKTSSDLSCPGSTIRDVQRTLTAQQRSQPDLQKDRHFPTTATHGQGRLREGGPCAPVTGSTRRTTVTCNFPGRLEERDDSPHRRGAGGRGSVSKRGQTGGQLRWKGNSELPCDSLVIYSRKLKTHVQAKTYTCILWQRFPNSQKEETTQMHIS